MSEVKRQLSETFFKKLVVPDNWTCKGNNDIPYNGEIISYGKVYQDKLTSGLDLKIYKVVFLVFSEMGAICEKTILDYGKYKYHCVSSNKTIEQINEYIAEHYFPKEDNSN